MSTLDHRAVSPVVGIVLLVGLTVLLAGVTGMMFLGIGDALEDDGTTATFDVEYEPVDGDHDELRITHVGGDGLDPDRIRITISGAADLDPDTGADSEDLRYLGSGSAYAPTSPLTAGDSITLDDSVNWQTTDPSSGTVVDYNLDSDNALDLGGATIHVLYVNEDRSHTTLLYRWVGPETDREDG